MRRRLLIKAKEDKLPYIIVDDFNGNSDLWHCTVLVNPKLLDSLPENGSSLSYEQYPEISQLRNDLVDYGTSKLGRFGSPYDFKLYYANTDKYDKPNLNLYYPQFILNIKSPSVFSTFDVSYYKNYGVYKDGYIIMMVKYWDD